MWRLCLIIRDVMNICDDTIYNLLAYVCDWSLGTHKILHPILSLKSGATAGVTQMVKLESNIKVVYTNELYPCSCFAKVVAGVEDEEVAQAMW